jgi:hypothetical protein
LTDLAACGRLVGELAESMAGWLFFVCVSGWYTGWVGSVGWLVDWLGWWLVGLAGFLVGCVVSWLKSHALASLFKSFTTLSARKTGRVLSCEEFSANRAD